MMQLLLKLMFT